jgi:hypothetical protein
MMGFARILVVPASSKKALYPSYDSFKAVGWAKARSDVPTLVSTASP